MENFNGVVFAKLKFASYDTHVQFLSRHNSIIAQTAMGKIFSTSIDESCPPFEIDRNGSFYDVEISGGRIKNIKKASDFKDVFSNTLLVG